jgi:hypothetical protein
MAPEHAHLGRWQRDLSPEATSELEEAYLALFHDLILEGIRCRPVSPLWRTRHD